VFVPLKNSVDFAYKNRGTRGTPSAGKVYGARVHVQNVDMASKFSSACVSLFTFLQDPWCPDAAAAAAAARASTVLGAASRCWRHVEDTGERSDDVKCFLSRLSHAGLPNTTSLAAGLATAAALQPPPRCRAAASAALPRCSAAAELLPPRRRADVPLGFGAAEDARAHTEVIPQMMSGR